MNRNNIRHPLIAPLVVLAFLGTSLPGADIRRDATVAAIEKVMPSVVNIGTETVVEVRDPFGQMLQEYFNPYYRRRPQNTTYSLGSGVIFDEEGYVLTNNHVVRRATRIWVKLMDGGEFEAKLIAGDAKSDVALLKIQAPEGRKFNPVAFAQDDDLLLGETVLALGNPFGLGGSVSKGILSSKSRRQAREDEPLNVADWLQTDAAINPGNSGGPLINLRGELIGLSVAVYRDGQGIGFAIPVRRVTDSLSRFLSPEQAGSLWFGALIRPGVKPLQVASVQKSSPADVAGLKAGDLIESVNGHEPRSFMDFARELMSGGESNTVRLAVRQAGKSRNLNVRLVPEKEFFNARLIHSRLGVTLQELTAQLASRLGFPFYGGFVVTDVEKDGPGEKARLREYDVIQAMDGNQPQDLVELAKAVHAKDKGQTVTFDLIVRVRQGMFQGFRDARAQIVTR